MSFHMMTRDSNSLSQFVELRLLNSNAWVQYGSDLEFPQNTP